MTQNHELHLAHGLTLRDLYQREGLERIDGLFVTALEAEDESLAGRLRAARAEPQALSTLETSELMLALAPRLEAFLAELFGIEEAVDALTELHRALDPLFFVKRKFVQRQAVKFTTPEEAATYDGAALRAELTRLFGGRFDQELFARFVSQWMAEADTHVEQLDAAKRYAAWAVHTPEGRRAHAHDVLFRTAQGVDPMALVPAARPHAAHGTDVYTISVEHLRRRKGFALTDPGGDLRYALDQANYCIICHPQGRDSCSKGLRNKGMERGKDAFKTSPFGVTLAGCPLEERISEFHQLKSQGCAIGALAVICVDNPLVAATGHRICNDCMKACIYQRQQPVDIPQIETRTLKDVLGLPWGFEIYSLLTRWNPLDWNRPVPRPASGKRVLVVGMGPAGFTLAHHLVNDGHTVVGIDGLKIEPLPAELNGVDPDGTRAPFQPIRDFDTLLEELDSRVLAGFGGVAEYGITVRWDKNFLKVVRLLLERRDRFALLGGVRFGGTITAEQAFDYGFDHVALAIGAGKPTVLSIPNGLARGVRAASDFLMALQLTGAAREDSIANLQVRMPIVVIGGGLTAIDTATESLAYYAVQVEKFLQRYERLAAEQGEDAVRAGWGAEEAEIAAEFLAHGRALRDERERAERAGQAPRIVELLQGWGGATIAYRKRLVDSPSYTLNHEEVEKALEEGIAFAECLSPAAVDVDAHGSAMALRMRRQLRSELGQWSDGEEVTLPARTVFVAAGTQPNTVLAREDAGHFDLNGRYFTAIDEAGEQQPVEHSISKPEDTRILTHRTADGRFVSFFGDVHPSFFGNVVKAMGSAKRGYPIVSRVLEARAPASGSDDAEFVGTLRTGLQARVFAVRRLTPTIVEVIVRAPWAARQFRPGQFYRLQNYESYALRDAEAPSPTLLQMEGLALTGAWVDVTQGLVSTIVLEMGGSADLCARLQPGEPVVLMGPTGTPTDIPAGETVVLVGGGLGNAVLFSIGTALRAAGSRVLYFAGYKKLVDRYKVAEIEAAADVVVWCCDEAPGFEPGRPQDRAYVGNIVQAMQAYGSGALGAAEIPLQAADRLIAIGSDRMMAAVARARHGVLAPMLKPDHVAIGSINSPMQCMMKEICAQCLQRQVDPVTGKEQIVFSCFNQDQPLDLVDWSCLDQRLRQNSLQEKLTARWIGRALGRIDAA